MTQNSFAFGEEQQDPVYDWNPWDPWPEGLSHQAYLILQIRRDLRAAAEATEDEMREFFQERVVRYRDTYNANKRKEAEPQDPSSRSPA